MPDDPRHYMDFTGTGNSLNADAPERAAADHGLAALLGRPSATSTASASTSRRALARELYDVDRLSAFFDVIHQDPVLSQVKLIAEPWDVGPGGYQVGNFPVLWSEWNGIYRDAMRDFWRGAGAASATSPRALTGSSDLYEDDGRHPFASINFITAHDGFTLRDLVSYNDKHNEANLEDNRDGTDDNRSWNCGVEGQTDDPEINALRARQQRNFLATLLLSQGTPMLLGGDEFGPHPARQQQRLVPGQRDLLVRLGASPRRAASCYEFTQQLIALRRDAPGVPPPRSSCTGVERGGLRPARRLVVPHRRAPDDQARLADGGERCVGMFLNGEEIADARTRTASAIVDDSFLLLFNAHHEDVHVHAAAPALRRRWALELSHRRPGRASRTRSSVGAARATSSLVARSLVLLRRAS